jgi:hypothetical protein
VSQAEPIKKLQDFAENNQVTTGKFTIGDEKVRLILKEKEDDSILIVKITEAQCFYESQRKSDDDLDKIS